MAQTSFIYLFIAIPIYFSLAQTNIHSNWFEKNWEYALKYLFYSLALLFAILHLPTLDLTTAEQLFFWPLLILPFLVYAFVFSYVRIRIGFAYAVLLHFFIDLIVIILQN
ncbi:hypothetical protein [Sunxiuqinia sp. sy24]|uniref:hypothetical protein n=1 Tax=Sunxiuqinia sp. sy24 TaxID=3461495 RepID=UPI004045DE9E